MGSRLENKLSEMIEAVIGVRVFACITRTYYHHESGETPVLWHMMSYDGDRIESRIPARDLVKGKIRVERWYGYEVFRDEAD